MKDESHCWGGGMCAADAARLEGDGCQRRGRQWVLLSSLFTLGFNKNQERQEPQNSNVQNPMRT
eukprot:1505997-Amphidinium_carterae.1